MATGDGMTCCASVEGCHGAAGGDTYARFKVVLGSGFHSITPNPFVFLRIRPTEFSFNCFSRYISSLTFFAMTRSLFCFFLRTQNTISRMIPIKTAVAETDATITPVLLMGVLGELALADIEVDDGELEATIEFGVVLEDCDELNEVDVTVIASTLVTDLLARLEGVSVEDGVVDVMGVGESVEDSVVGVSEVEESVVVLGGVIVEEAALGLSVWPPDFDVLTSGSCDFGDALSFFLESWLAVDCAPRVGSITSLSAVRVGRVSPFSSLVFRGVLLSSSSSSSSPTRDDF